MATTNIERLEQQIEQLIRDYIAEVRRNAVAAMERAFASSTSTKSLSVVRSTPRVAGRRRGADELSGLADRLYSAVCAHPGSTMATLAPHVGATVRDLNRPAKLLKEAGRIRIVGERNATHYFPMGKKSTA